MKDIQPLRVAERVSSPSFDEAPDGPVCCICRQPKPSGGPPVVVAVPRVEIDLLPHDLPRESKSGMAAILRFPVAGRLLQNEVPNQFYNLPMRGQEIHVSYQPAEMLTHRAVLASDLVPRAAAGQPGAYTNPPKAWKGQSFCRSVSAVAP